MDKIGRYEIRGELGAGSMGRVYKAFDPDIGRPLAIKVLLAELQVNDEYRERFLREARGAGGLSHPNIVTVYDVGQYQASPYIVMEYVEGGTLADVIRRGQRLPVETVVDVGIQLARALDFAHKAGIVHRDVKPSNIMVLKDGKTIKVADFGICRIDTGDATHKTRVGDVLGTPHYMSPEQVVGAAVDARSDLFSAGVVLYELLAGKLPFEGDTFVSVAVKISNTEPPSLDKLRPDLPLALRRVVDHALQKQPDQRFKSGAELAEALVQVAREMAAARARGERRRRVPLGLKWAAGMALLVVLTMGLTTALIHQRQYGALRGQVTDYGGSLVKFMAAQNAVPLLSEDWVAVEVFIQATTRGQDFGYLIVVDREGIVRGSDKPAQVGQKFAPTRSGASIATREAGVTVHDGRSDDGRALLDFAAPVLFQGREVGAVHLGIFQQPLEALSRLTLGLLALLTVITAAAAAIGTWFLARRIAAPARVLRSALQELAKGRYDYRIGEARKDEFGELFAAFDATAAALRQRHAPPPTITVTPATLAQTLGPGLTGGPGTTSGPAGDETVVVDRPRPSSAKA